MNGWFTWRWTAVVWWVVAHFWMEPSMIERIFCAHDLTAGYQMDIESSVRRGHQQQWLDVAARMNNPSLWIIVGCSQLQMNMFITSKLTTREASMIGGWRPVVSGHVSGSSLARSPFEGIDGYSKRLPTWPKRVGWCCGYLPWLVKSHEGVTDDATCAKPFHALVIARSVILQHVATGIPKTVLLLWTPLIWRVHHSCTHPPGRRCCSL